MPQMSLPTPDILARIKAVGEGKTRVFVAIAGPPGAGKSTFTDTLVAALEGAAAVVPMDGFHKDNETLRAQGSLARKGAPDTFDPSALLAMLGALREGDDVWVPRFDRAADCVREHAMLIPAATKVVIVEGNYVLLDAPIWRDMQGIWDLTIMLRVDEAELGRRLVQRWLDHGLDQQAAQARAQSNDLRNAKTVRDGSRPADVVVSAQ